MTKGGSFTVDFITLLTFFDALDELVADCRLHINKDLVSVRTVDRDHIAYLEMQLTGFSEMNCKNPVTICIDVSGPRSFLKAMIDQGIVKDLHSPVKFTWDDSLIHIEPVSTGMVAQYEPVKDKTVKKDPNQIVFSSDVSFECDPDQFFKASTITTYFDDGVCRVHASKKGVFILGGESPKMLHALLSTGCNGSSGLSRYSTNYIRGIARALKQCTSNHLIRFSTDRPLHLLNINGVPGLRVEYALAPRIMDG